LSQEKVLKTLETLGIEQPEAQVYVLLGKKGPQKAMEIARFLKISKQTAYRAIKALQAKGIISATIEHPSKFIAVSFEKVLDLFMKAKTEEVRCIEKDKEVLLSDWKSIAIADAGDNSPRFTVIEGRKFIYSRLKQMVEGTRSKLSIISTVPSLMRADQFGLLDAAFEHTARTNVKLEVLTELSFETLRAMKSLLEEAPKKGNFQVRTPELGLNPISRMIIKDNEEAAFFLGQETDKTPIDMGDLCLWTNSNAIINSFNLVFEDLWKNSAEISKKIAELETGQPAAKTCNIIDPEAAKKTYEGLMNTAKSEITMITSSKGLIEACNNVHQLRKLAQNGISVKIMAPIVKDNLKAALLISGFGKVRHVATSYLETTIIDRKHLFQFKNPPDNRDGISKVVSKFENTFYTNESDYVEKTEHMLDVVWEHAITPSSLTVEEITKPPIPSTFPVPDDENMKNRKGSPYQKGHFGIGSLMEKRVAVTKEYVLNKIINAKRIPAKYPWRNPIYQYGGTASAVIHPPSNLNLPDIVFTFTHYTKQSSSALEDSFYVSLLLDTPKGKLFVPVAGILDNPEGVERWRVFFEGTPAGQNIQLLRKDEVQIQFFGNTMFAGWTVPIKLFPPPFVLPPGGVLVEGYGKARINVLKATMPSGGRAVSEVYCCNAFVTYFHPASKYAGPGTDGVVGDMVQTLYPPPVPKADKNSG
jgi:sugar-specific transcriptional regulator TrmB